MELKEFVRLDPKQVRRDNKLMLLFVDFYKAAFSVTPNCAGCVFKNGFRKLKRYAENKQDSQKISTFGKTTIKMEKQDKTFQLKPKYRLKILTFKKDGATHRRYGYNLTEEFARELVKAGKSDLFLKVPEKEELKGAKKQTGKDLDSLRDVNTLDALADFGQKEPKEPTIPEPVSYENLDWNTDILPMYAEVKKRTGKKADSQKKVDVIKFLKENELA